MGLAGTRRSEEDNRSWNGNAVLLGQFVLCQRQDDLFVDNLLGRLRFGNRIPDGSVKNLGAHAFEVFNLLGIMLGIINC